LEFALVRSRHRLPTGKGLAGLVLAVACAVAASAASPALADRFRIERLVRLSEASPFPGPCGADNVIAQRDAEVEPSIAVDPRAPRRIVVAWMQDDGRSNLVMASRNGGRTWTRVFVPGLTDCTGGTFSAAADPWLSFARDGQLLLSSGIANLPHLPGANGFRPSPMQVVSRSGDGGLSWSLPATAQFAPGVYSDRSAATADPFRRGRAYEVWTVRSGPDANTGSAWFSRSSDGGRTWSPPRLVYDPGKEEVAPFGVIAVLPHRVLLYVTQVVDSAASTSDMMAARSVDGGRTWSRPALIAHTSGNSAIDPDAGTVVAGTPANPSVTVGPHGVPTVAWNDIASPHASRTVAARSGDGGRSWSRPVAVSRVRGQAIQASVAAAGDGTLGITWYDDRRDPGGSSAAWDFDVWFAFSRDGGRSWRRRHLAGPFDMNRAQAVEGVARRIGDYQSLAGLPHGFAAAFVQARPRAKIGASDVFFARVRTGHRPRRPGHRR
jgi:hypothetical protein